MIVINKKKTIWQPIQTEKFHIRLKRSKVKSVII